MQGNLRLCFASNSSDFEQIMESVYLDAFLAEFLRIESDYLSGVFIFGLKRP